MCYTVYTSLDSSYLPETDPGTNDPSIYALSRSKGVTMFSYFRSTNSPVFGATVVMGSGLIIFFLGVTYPDTFKTGDGVYMQGFGLGTFFSGLLAWTFAKTINLKEGLFDIPIAVKVSIMLPAGGRGSLYMPWIGILHMDRRTGKFCPSEKAEDRILRILDPNDKGVPMLRAPEYRYDRNTGRFEMMGYEYTFERYVPPQPEPALTKPGSQA